MDILIYTGFNGLEVEAFIKEHELNHTEFVWGEGEVLGYGGYHKPPCVLIVDNCDVCDECIILPKRYYDSLRGE